MASLIPLLTATSRNTAFFLGLALVLIACDLRAQEKQEKDLWDKALQRSPWVFLGDSNTYSGRYVAILDAWLDAADLPQRPEILNLGVSSETAAGTSEIDHPFKRPCVHERVDKALSMTRPGVVFVCYGMNDGIYEPYNPEVFDAYERGMQELADHVLASGAIFVVLTPPLFESDALRIHGKPFGPNPQGRYAYNAPFEDYDQVIERMAAFCLQNSIGANLVVDLRTALAEEKALRREQDPQFLFSRDGVHFNSEAHGIVAESILVGLGAPTEVLIQVPSDEQMNEGYRRMKLLRDAYLSAVGKNRPSLPAGLPLWYAHSRAQQSD